MGSKLTILALGILGLMVIPGAAADVGGTVTVPGGHHGEDFCVVDQPERNATTPPVETIGVTVGVAGQEVTVPSVTVLEEQEVTVDRIFLCFENVPTDPGLGDDDDGDDDGDDDEGLVPPPELTPYQ